MMKKLVLIIGIIVVLFSPLNAFAEEKNSSSNGGAGTFDACKNVVSGQTAVCSGSAVKAEDVVKNAISVLLWVVGTIAVIVIIYAGITFITAAGDPNKIVLAKRMIIYSVVGLAVAILAYAIVNFVVNASSGNGANGGSSGSSSGSSNTSSGNAN